MVTMYRLFIAVELSKPVIDYLVDLQGDLKSIKAVRWAKPTQFHLTLQFLGDTPVNQIDALTVALIESVGIQTSFDLSLGDLGVFPNFKRPRVIWLGVHAPNNLLQTLHQQVSAATQKFGVKADKYDFKPHLTLGRTQKWAKSKDYTQIAEIVRKTAVRDGITSPVKNVSLIRSQLKPTGPIYTTLAEIGLGTF